MKRGELYRVCGRPGDPKLAAVFVVVSRLPLTDDMTTQVLPERDRPCSMYEIHT
jgi:hypothetical protein